MSKSQFPTLSAGDIRRRLAALRESVRPPSAPTVPVKISQEFKIDDIVRLRPGLFDFGRRGLHEILAVLPEGREGKQYRVKHLTDGFERIVHEREMVHSVERGPKK